jgi:1-acyl-sn-glycerol-3-phosphate acyltransferase
MTTPEPSTPDIDRRPFTFEPASRRDALRTSIGAAILAHASLRAGATLAPRISRPRQRSLESAWATITRRALRIDLRVTGIERIDVDRRYLVMPLHESFIDIPVLLRLPLALRFVVRDELTRLPSVGGYLRATGQIAVPEEPLIHDLRTLAGSVADALSEGDSVVVFPQGSVLGIESSFQRGVGWLARRLGVPVLPVVIAGTHHVWGFPFDTTVRFDQRVALEVLDPVEGSTLTDETLRSLERTMKRRALEGGVQPRRYIPERDGWWDGYRFGIDPDFPELATAVAAQRAQVRGDRRPPN